MQYSLDLRRKVIKFVTEGGKKTEAARIFNIGRDTIYRWLRMDDLTPKPNPPRLRKICSKDLLQRVKQNPDARLIDHAKALNVSVPAIHYRFKQLGIVKKNDPLRRTSMYTKDSVSE